MCVHAREVVLTEACFHLDLEVSLFAILRGPRVQVGSVNASTVGGGQARCGLEGRGGRVTFADASFGMFCAQVPSPTLNLAPTRTAAPTATLHSKP